MCIKKTELITYQETKHTHGACQRTQHFHLPLAGLYRRSRHASMQVIHNSSHSS
jgi:hypothetical protein